MRNPNNNGDGLIIVQEGAGVERWHVPVRLGVPCPKGKFFTNDNFRIVSSREENQPVQCRAISSWPDGSTKWLLTDFFADVSAHGKASYVLRHDPDAGNDVASDTAITIQETPTVFNVSTGLATFSIPKNEAIPFNAVMLKDREVLSGGSSDLMLNLPNGQRPDAIIERCRLIERGPLRATVVREGRFVSSKNKTLSRFCLYQTFFSGSTVCRIDCSIHNPHAALHPDGLWDLGDAGSFYFDEFSINLTANDAFDHLEWKEEYRSSTEHSSNKKWALYQDSSGLENWNSVNHIDKNRQSTVSFPGYRIYSGEDALHVIREGGQAKPYLKICTSSGWIAGTLHEFWENFPSSLEADDGQLKIGIFPNRPLFTHELQGGEKKCHTLLLEFGHPGQMATILQMHPPLNVFPAPEWTESTMAIPWFTVQEDDSAYRAYIGNITEGPHSFFEKRRIIDEYGWRNFGDLYADHEAVHHQEPHAFVAHYNNQYDFIYGGIVHFLRSGKPEWFNLACGLAKHSMDIDIYHTNEDKAAFNHGQFWHTDHYKEAHTCTHRGFSRLNRTGNEAYGGGPSNENLYASGLLHYYFLTGDPMAREAVLELAEWVIGMDDGSRTIFAIFDDGSTGLATQTADTEFHKPGRGAGNSINTLMDAFHLTHSHHYLEMAESLIRRCIHPKDDIAALDLDDPEKRWSYLVFLQVLGKYLELKVEWQALDARYYYARDSLLHYARWMSANEKPYEEVLHKVELPTETWPAQDIRKNHVFHLAAKYAHPDERCDFREQALYYFDRCLKGLLKFETAYTTRAMVLLSVYGYIHTYFQSGRAGSIPYSDHSIDFGSTAAFIPQKTRFRRTFIHNMRESVKAARQLIQPKLSKWIQRR